MFLINNKNQFKKPNTMKKIISLSMMLMFGIMVFAQQKEAEDKNNLISFSLTNLVANNMTFSYERMFGSSGLMLSGGITLTDDSYESKLGNNAELQFRLYPNLQRESVFQGFYIGPYASWLYLDEKTTYWDYCGTDDEWLTCESSNRNIYNNFGGGVVVGIKIAIAQKMVFTFESGGGLRYSTGKKPDNNYYNTGISPDYVDQVHPSYTGIAPKMNISFGYFF